MEAILIIISIAILFALIIISVFLFRKPKENPATVQYIQQLKLDNAISEERLGQLKKQYETELDAERARANEQHDSFVRQIAELHDTNDRQLAELKEAHAKQLIELKEAHAKQLEMLAAEHARRETNEREVMSERFKALASDVLQANSTQLEQRSRQSLEAALSPMKSSLEAFTKGYRECYDIENRDRMTLREEIRSLHELNTRVEREASKLSTALKGNTSVQGQWGEMVLTNILEHSGLQKSRWFVTQESSTDEDGTRLRPDAIIHCPKNRDIIIDSKVSIAHYLRMTGADTPEQRQALAKEHVQSVETHIKELRDKDYQNKIGAKNGDFVLMFMPHEGAYIEAMNLKPDLWQKAYEGHVIIVSPTHLVTVVRLVEQMWQNEDRTVNSEKIASTAKAMIDSVQAFLTDMATIGTQLSKAHTAYDSALKRLTTGNNNVMRVANKLQALGIKSKKAMPAPFDNVDDSDNELSDNSLPATVAPEQ